MKSYVEFITEKLNNDDIIDLYQNFSRILKIHEDHFYHKNLISNNLNFKSELNKIFAKLGKVITEDLYNLVIKFEKELYNNNLIQSDYGSSLYDVCEVIIEDPDTLNVNRYIQDFSDKDVYVGTSDDTDNVINNIDSTIKGLDNMSQLSDVIADVWDAAVEEGGDDEDKILNIVIDRLSEYKTIYPHLSKKIQEEIDDLIKYK